MADIPLEESQSPPPPRKRTPYDPFLRSSYSTILPAAFDCDVVIVDFRKHVWKEVPELKKNITEYEDILPQIQDNAKKMDISRLTSLQATLLTNFVIDDGHIDYIIKTPHLCGLTFGAGLTLVSYVMNYHSYPRTRPTTFAPMIIVLCENESAVSHASSIFCKIAFQTGVTVISQRKKNVEITPNCDILIADPFMIANLDEAKKLDRSRIRVVFADWADKIYKTFELGSAMRLINYLSEANAAVRIIGCEYIYESRLEYFSNSMRENAVEIRIQTKN